MSQAYWLGVATPFAVAALIFVLSGIYARLRSALRLRGWFMETGSPPKSIVDAWSRLSVRGRFGFHVGLYRTTSGWGSRWVALGPVTVGRKSAALALSEKPPPEERDKPGPGQSWQWGASA